MQRHRPVSRLHFLRKAASGLHQGATIVSQKSLPSLVAINYCVAQKSQIFSATANFPSNIHPPKSGSAQDGSTHTWRKLLLVMAVLLKHEKGVSSQSKSDPQRKPNLYASQS